MNRVLVLDGGYFLFRSINAFRLKFSPPVGWYYLRMICANLKRLEVDLDDIIILGKDSPQGSWRKEIDRNYKANRRAKREELEDKEFWEDMFKSIDSILQKMNLSMPIHVVECYKTEFDDVASVCCRFYPDKEIIIVSADRDLEQLASYPNVSVFSPITKKFKEIKNPEAILLEKIQGDVSDNLRDKPITELDYEKRKMIVNLCELPLNIEIMIKEQLTKLMPKNILLNKIPYNSIKQEIKKIYKLGE